MLLRVCSMYFLMGLYGTDMQIINWQIADLHTEVLLRHDIHGKNIMKFRFLCRREFENTQI